MSKTRRKRPVPEDWASGEDIASYASVATSEALYPGSKVLALDESGDNALIGGSDGIAGVYSISQKRVVDALKGGGGSVSAGVWAGSKAIIATSAGKVKVFEGQQEVASFQTHAGTVTGLALHPSGDILASVGSDKSYVLYDLESSQVLKQGYTSSGKPWALTDFNTSTNRTSSAHDGQIPPRWTLACSRRSERRHQDLRCQDGI